MTADEIIDEVVRREGGYSDRKADRGGPTNFGITQKKLSEWRGKPVTAADVKAMSVLEAKAIYRADYVAPWEFLGHDAPGLFELLVDWTSTSWVDDPTRALQAALAKRGHAVKVDGALGSKTREAWKVAVALNRAVGLLIEVDVAKARHNFYVDLALNEPDVQVFIATHPKTQLRNLRGWLNRSLEFL